MRGAARFTSLPCSRVRWPVRTAASANPDSEWSYPAHRTPCAHSRDVSCTAVHTSWTWPAIPCPVTSSRTTWRAMGRRRGGAICSRPVAESHRQPRRSGLPMAHAASVGIETTQVAAGTSRKAAGAAGDCGPVNCINWESTWGQRASTAICRPRGRNGPARWGQHTPLKLGEAG